MAEEIPQLDPERNERACRLIMHGIALLPQSNDSYPIVADSVLRSYTAATENLVDIRDIARVDPLEFDGLSGVVHAIHHRFKIQARPRPEQIAPHVIFVGASAIDHIGETVRGAHYRLGRRPPKGLRCMEINWTRVAANAGYADLLHNYLQDPDILSDVASTIRDLAYWTKKGSQIRQAHVVDGYFTRMAEVADALDRFVGD